MESNSYGEEFHQWENLPRKKVLYGVITLTTLPTYIVFFHVISLLSMILVGKTY